MGQSPGAGRLVEGAKQSRPLLSVHLEPAGFTTPGLLAVGLLVESRPSYRNRTPNSATRNATPRSQATGLLLPVLFRFLVQPLLVLKNCHDALPFARSETTARTRRSYRVIA
jgi:hypothetical protein